MAWRVPIVFDGDVFAIVDDGEITVDEYVEIEELIVAHGALHRGGLGCVVVIPAGTKPPSEAQRLAIGSVLTLAAPYLIGLVWVVEAGGFEGAAVRGVLVGLNLFVRKPYPTQVSSQIHDALGWLATRRSGMTVDIEAVANKVAQTRADYASTR